MHSRLISLLLIAGVSFGLCASGSAAPTLTMGLELLDRAGASVPIDGDFHNHIARYGVNAYVLDPGAVFLVRVSATITNPQSSDASHTDAANGNAPLPPIQLGIQQLTFNVVSNTLPATMLNPLDTSPSSGHWAATGASSSVAIKSAQPSSVNYVVTNLIDIGGDGDLDPSGAGYINNNPVYDGTDTPTNLGLANGLTNATVITGAYEQSNSVTGFGTLDTVVTAADYLDENSASDNSLTFSAFPQENIHNASVTIGTYIPEPSSTGVLGLISFGLRGRRSQKTK